MDQLDLSDFFQTKPQAVDFSTRLSAISEKIYETTFNLEKSLTEQFGMHKKDKFVAMLRNNNINVGSSSELKATLDKIQASVSTLPVISLTIAIEPSEKILKSLSDWTILNIKKQALFDIHIDPNLIGGTTINYSGKYADFSVKPIFDKVLADSLHLQQAQPTTTVPINYAQYHATALSAQFLNNAQPLVH